MNCIYRIVWNAAIGKWVVASELARGRRRRRRLSAGLAAAVLALASHGVLAEEINTVLCTAPLHLQDGACVPTNDGRALLPMADTDDSLLVVNAGSNPAAASMTGVGAIAIGSNAIARTASNGANNGMVALGANANAAGSNAVAVGYGAAADSQNGSGTSGATARGTNSRATWNATAVGFQANGNGTVVTALGSAATVTGERGVGMGRSATATGQYSTAIGAGARATHGNSVAIGEGSVSRATNTVAVGATNRLRGIEQLADGTEANDAITVAQMGGLLQAIGGGAGMGADGSATAPVFDLANGGRQTTVGGALSALDGGLSTLHTTVNTLDEQVRLGRIGLVQQTAAGVDLGVGASRDGAAVRMQGLAGARRLSGVADASTASDVINKGQQDAGVSSVAAALGGGAAVEADGRLRAPTYNVVGTTVHRVGDALQALDSEDTAQRDALDQLGDAVGLSQRYFKAVAMPGDAPADASGTAAIAIGASAIASAQQSLALGAGARADGSESVAVGAGAHSSGDSSIALGAGAVADRNQVLSIGGGSVGARQLVNVASGTEATDTVNARQLQVAVDALGGGARFDAATGVVSGPDYDVQGARYNDAGSALSAIDASLQVLDERVTVNEDDVLDAQKTIDAWNSGDAGLVRQTGADAQVTVAASRAGSAVDVRGTEGARQVKGVATGTEDSDVATLAQMQQGLDGAQPQDSRYLKVDGAADGSDNAVINGRGAVAVGASARADGEGSLALGQGAQALADGAVALGAGSLSDRAGSVSVGRLGGERQITHVADGSEDTDAINLRQLKAAGLVGDDGQIRDALGYVAGSDHSQVQFGGALGTVLANVADGRVQAGSRDAVNGGQLAAVSAALGSALDDLGGRVGALEGSLGDGGSGGDIPYYGATGNTAVVADGAPAEATGAGAVAAGSGAQATADDSVALGADAVADRAGSVSVGHVGGERQITHVAAGTADTDMVNVAQLQEQMASANRYTDQRVEAMEQAMGTQMGHMARQVSRGIAASAALVQVTPNLPGKVTLNAGMATYRGESAFALGLSRWSRSGRYNVNGGVSMARGDQPLISIGFGVAFD